MITFTNELLEGGYIMANGWTDERRKKQSELIRGWQPWNNSTGPKTGEGKKISSRNSIKLGLRSAEFTKVFKILSESAKVERTARKRFALRF